MMSRESTYVFIFIKNLLYILSSAWSKNLGLTHHNNRGNSMRKLFTSLGLLIIAHAALKGFENEPYKNAFTINKGTHIVLIGNNLCSRMMNFGHFETEVYLRYPKSKLTIRNMCDGGNTPGFRPHSGRLSPWAFPGTNPQKISIWL